jgi:hypothetical protein
MTRAGLSAPVCLYERVDVVGVGWVLRDVVEQVDVGGVDDVGRIDRDLVTRRCLSTQEIDLARIATLLSHFVTPFSPQDVAR